MSVARARNTDDSAARAQAVALLFTYIDRLKMHFFRVAEAHNLTAVQARALLCLEQPSPMHCIAENLSCDPSNITGVVDRLQERGLLSREESAKDRRVKSLQLTPAGRKLREAFTSALYQNVPGIDGLSSSEVANLRRALTALCREDSSDQ